MNPVAVAFALRALVGIVAYFGIKLKEPEVAVCIKLLGKTQSERYQRDFHAHTHKSLMALV